MSERIVYLNGRFLPYDQASVPMEDRGHQFGDGVYEVIKVYGRDPFRLEEHLERFEASARGLEIPLPLTQQELAQVIMEFIERSQREDFFIYFQLTRGTAPRDHPFPKDARPSLSMHALDFKVPTSLYEEGARVIVLEDERWLRCHIKSINLLPNLLAKEEAKRRGCQEALLYRDGVGVIEGTASNLFLIQGGALVTAPLSRYILPGITRQEVLQIAVELNIPVQLRNPSLTDLHSAQEVFITSTGIEVLGVVQVNGAPVGEGRPGPLTRRIAQAFQMRIKKG